MQRTTVRAVLVALTISTPAAYAAEDQPWLSDEQGCKVLSPAVIDLGKTSLDWSGLCVEGFATGPGKAEIVSDRGFIVVLEGDFVEGKASRGTLEINGSKYEGELKNNIPQGSGTLKSVDGRSIRGEFAAGDPVAGGRFELTWRDGGRYEGEIDHRWRMHGRGHIVYADGSDYAGEFSEDRLDGEGTYKPQSGEIRKGTFRKGLLEGAGSIEYVDGSRYSGQLKAGQPSGQGAMTYSNGASYVGDFLAGKSHGKGKLNYANGSWYEGEFIGGQPHGTGTEHYANDAVYVGGFVSARRHGTGTLTFATGQRHEGEWRDGNLHGQCIVVDAEQAIYKGDCRAGKPSGSGRWEDAKASKVYEGEFREGRFSGQGKLTTPDDTYTGVFKEGLKEGLGKQEFADGAVYEGMFSRDLFHGAGSLRSKVLSYDGNFVKGLMDGKGILKGARMTMDGTFEANAFVSGRMILNDGRTFEVDPEAGLVHQLLPDGTRVQVDRVPTNAVD